MPQDKQDIYERAGVSYADMDPFKVAAQRAAAETDDVIADTGYKVVEWSRGESAFLMEGPGHYIAHVEEGLGTKNLIADALLSHAVLHGAIAQCTVAMIVNDLITVGARPISIAMHLAVGDSSWFRRKDRYQALLAGWRDACILSLGVFAGGETPTLRDIIVPGACEISGSAIGIINPKSRVIRPAPQEGDRIVLVESSGIHANGLTLARKVADGVDEGYMTPVEDGGLNFGLALLEPTHIYVQPMEACLRAGVEIHSAINITGHGWRKLMRARDNFVYVIEEVPTPQPLFNFIQERERASDYSMYSDLNMGGGFALIVPPSEEAAVHRHFNEYGLRTWKGGYVAKDGNRKAVEIRPLDIVFEGESMTLR